MATRLDIVIDQGGKFFRNIAVKNNDGTVKDLTGYSGRMQFRSSPSSAIILLEASTANGRISINSPGGIVTVNIGADVTAPLTWTAAVYDLEVFTVDPAEVIRILEGSASLSLEVTH